MRIMKPSRSVPTLPSSLQTVSLDPDQTDNSSGASPIQQRPLTPTTDQSPTRRNPHHHPGSRPARLQQLFFGGRSSSTSSDLKSARCVRVGSGDEQLRKNRHKVDHLLRRLGGFLDNNNSSKHQQRKLPLSLHPQSGKTYFSYKKFVVVIEVPVDHCGNLLVMYTCVCRLDNVAHDNRAVVLQRAMELNYMEYATRGATLGLEAGEVNLCYSTPICGLVLADLREAVEAFLVTCVEVNEQLEGATKRYRGASGTRT